MRHWSLTRMLCWPLRSPFSASSRLPGGTSKSRSERAWPRYRSFLRAGRSIARKRATGLSLNSASVSGERKDLIMRLAYYVARNTSSGGHWRPREIPVVEKGDLPADHAVPLAFYTLASARVGFCAADPRRDAHSQRVELDEAGGVGLIVSAAVFLESGDGRVEERVPVGLAADDGDVALVELQAHAAVHAGLRSVDQGLQEFPLRAPPVAVVDEARVARHQLVLEVRDLAVKAQGFDRAVRLQHDGSSGGLVAAARLHPDVAVLDEVEPPDAMLAAELVQRCEHRRRAHLPAVHRDDIPLLVVELDVLGPAGRLLGRHRPAPHVFLGLAGRILEDATFVGDVQQVRVHGVGRAALLLPLDGDAVLLRVLEKLFPRGEVPLAPGSDHADVRRERVVAELEAHLVVALAGRAVGDGVRPGLARDLDLALGDQRPGDRSSEKILAFVDRVRAEHGKHEIARELLAQVVDENSLDAELTRFFARRRELLALSYAGGEGHHLATVGVLQPLEDHRCVQAARIREDDFFDFARHLFLPSRLHLSEQQEFHQRLLGMQPVFRLVPHDALRAVDHRAIDFLAAVGGKTMHEKRVLLRGFHHLRVHLPVLEVALALLVLRLEAHAGPDVGGDQVRPARGLERIGEAFVVVVVVDAGALGLDLVAGRRRDVQVEIEHRSRLQPGVADVVRVPDPRDGFPLDGAAVLDVGVDVGEHLAGVVLVGEAVDHRHAGVRGETLDDLLLEGADHDEVAHARDHLPRVLDRLAPPELGVARVEVDRRAAELVHPRLERQPRPRRGLLENHGERAVLERPVAFVALEPLLDPARAREQVLVLPAREVLELQVVPRRGLRFHARAAAAAGAWARNSRASGTRMASTWRASASLMTSGGSKRMTLSIVTLISRPASIACLTRSPQGRSSSTPIIRPWPRTSTTPGCPASASRSPPSKIPPTRSAFFIRPSSSIAASVASAAAQASGLPPKVEPCVPGWNSCAAGPPARQTPIGTPEARPLASSTTSGRIPAC